MHWSVIVLLVPLGAIQVVMLVVTARQGAAQAATKGMPSHCF
jgi:hypothetical protein